MYTSQEKVSFETSRLAKQLGFDLPVTHYYRVPFGDPEYGLITNWNKNDDYWSAPELSVLIFWMNSSIDFDLKLEPTESDVRQALRLAKKLVHRI